MQAWMRRSKLPHIVIILMAFIVWLIIVLAIVIGLAAIVVAAMISHMTP